MKILRVEAVPLSIPCRHGAEGWTLGAGRAWAWIRMQT
jgi:hypothetical protein